MNLTGQKPHQKGVKRRRQKTEAERLDAEYLAWLRQQPSALEGRGPCEPAHVRRAYSSGVGIKPLFSAIPLTREQHQFQHQHGEREFLMMAHGVDCTVDEAKMWFEVMAFRHLRRWLIEHHTRITPHQNGAHHGETGGTIDNAE